MRNAILALLATAPGHGYELKQLIDDLFAGLGAPINVGQVYTTLQRLERDGLVQSYEVPQAGRPSKTIYEVTGAGREELVAWLLVPDGFSRPQGDIFMKVLMAERSGLVDTQDVISRQRAHYLGVLRSLDAMLSRDEASKPNRLLAEGAMLHVEADLRWLDRCEEELIGGAA